MSSIRATTALHRSLREGALVERLEPLSRHALLSDDVTTAVSAITNSDSPYTVTEDDHTIWVDTSGGAVTLNLPPAANVEGREYRVKHVTSDANAVTLDGDGSETVDGSATHVFGASALAARTVKSDGSNWHIVGGYL